MQMQLPYLLDFHGKLTVLNGLWYMTVGIKNDQKQFYATKSDPVTF